MKERTIQTCIIILSVVVGILLIFQISSIIIKGDAQEPHVEPINCETIVPMYFKPSELAIAAKMKSTKNIIAVIPEDNMLLARTEVLECPNFDYRDYVRVE